MAVPETPFDIACTVDDVAAIIRSRTKDSAGNEVGTFTADTRPTDAQCEVAIEHAVVLVHTKVGYIGDTCAALATGVVAIGAAAEIELSYFPEQSRSDRSVYTFLNTRWEQGLEGLALCVSGQLPSAEGAPDELEVVGTHASLDCISGVVHDHYAGLVVPPWVPPTPAEVTDDA